MQFYKGLMSIASTSLPSVSKLTMQGPMLTHQQKLLLNASITAVEVLSSLKAIGDDKDPGADRYNFVSFKKAWGIVQQDIIEAILESFHKGKMYKPKNYTSITLVPKKCQFYHSEGV